MTDTITVRVIRSLEHKNWKPLVVRNCDLDKWTLCQLRRRLDELLLDPTYRFPPPYTRDLSYYDCVKLETNPEANNSKSSNALINMMTKSMPFNRDSCGAEMDKSLRSLGLSNECEVSCFNSRDYEKYVIQQNLLD